MFSRSRLAGLPDAAAISSFSREIPASISRARDSKLTFPNRWDAKDLGCGLLLDFTLENECLPLDRDESGDFEVGP